MHRNTVNARRTIAALAVAAALIASFPPILIVGGHGVAPIGYLLLWAQMSFLSAIGWCGMFVAAVSAFQSPSIRQGVIATIGVLILTLAWAGFLVASESHIFTLITSIPFLGFASIRLVQVWLLIPVNNSIREE
jgi:hypothetical protein